MVTTEAGYVCPNCDGADVQLEMKMKHGVTQRQVDALLVAGTLDAVRTHSTQVLARCQSCDYTMEARE